jgi:hypothetical protein
MRPGGLRRRRVTAGVGGLWLAGYGRVVERGAAAGWPRRTEPAELGEDTGPGGEEVGLARAVELGAVGDPDGVGDTLAGVAVGGWFPRVSVVGRADGTPVRCGEGTGWAD